jgi:hypothetical protein
MCDNFDTVNYSPESIQTICLKAGENSCLLFCYLKAGGIDTIRAITDFSKLVAAKIIDINCTVLDANKLYKYFHKSFNVTKSDVPPENLNTLYAANYIFEDKNHWALMRNDDVIYSSLAFSKCVTYGSIAKKDGYRIINSTK